MTEVIRKGYCPECRRSRRLTQAGLLWAHKPYTRKSSAEMVPWCEGSGKPPRSTERST
jgi:hypothetical protein